MPASGARLAAGLQAFSHPAIVRDGTVQVRLDMTHVDAEAFSLPLEAMGGISVFRGGVLVCHIRGVIPGDFPAL
ncbi:hypothetical protein [Sulfobacillus thermosulfidooxidans]|uniref:hypothetical protein n=1 Tax=Sulfobacillus thermosulfidooxidans TaxID=28034 RepID=UPI0002E1D3D3|nr:hypothetical protein [Sulfobacillus thermosulfidooxidans]